jgi:hypothetical protein
MFGQKVKVLISMAVVCVYSSLFASNSYEYKKDNTKSEFQSIPYKQVSSISDKIEIFPSIPEDIEVEISKEDFYHETKTRISKYE